MRNTQRRKSGTSLNSARNCALSGGVAPTGIHLLWARPQPRDDRIFYMLDSFVWFRIFYGYQRSWTRRKGGGAVHTRYRAELLRSIAQTYNECLTFTVNGHRDQVIIDGRVPAKVFFPQEFLCLIELSKRFEFIGWFSTISASPRYCGRRVGTKRSSASSKATRT